MSLDKVTKEYQHDVIQKNFNYLEKSYQPRSHRSVSVVPANTDGVNGEVVVFDDGVSVKLYVKSNNAWKQVGLT